MVPFTKEDSVYLLTARIADNATSQALEPADGTYSLEANAYESFAVSVAIKNNKTVAVSSSVQFYGKDTADGDVTDTWTAIGVGGGTAPIVAASAATAGGKVLTSELHSRECAFKFITAVATVTFADQDTTTEASAVLRGVVARRA